MARAAAVVSGDGAEIQSLLDSLFFGEIPDFELAALVATDSGPSLRRGEAQHIPGYTVDASIFPNAATFTRASELHAARSSAAAATSQNICNLSFRITSLPVLLRFFLVLYREIHETDSNYHKKHYQNDYCSGHLSSFFIKNNPNTSVVTTTSATNKYKYQLHCSTSANSEPSNTAVATYLAMSKNHFPSSLFISFCKGAHKIRTGNGTRAFFQCRRTFFKKAGVSSALVEAYPTSNISRPLPTSKVS